MSELSQSDFMLVAEAAEYLRVAPSTIYGWVHCRKIPFRKHGSRVVLCRRDLDEWSQRQEIAVLDEESFLGQQNCVKRSPTPNRGRSLKIEQNRDQKAKHANGGL